MRRAFYTDACALALSEMGTEARLTFWRALELDFAQHGTRQIPASQQRHIRHLVKAIGSRLTALDARSHRVRA